MTRVVDLPDPLPDGGRFLHIGLPKTGTTALQQALDRARPELERLGAHNVSRDAHEMRVGQVAAGSLAEFWGDHWQGRWTELAADFRTSAARCTFWSSESLCQAPDDRIAYLAEQLGGDAHVVVTLRPLAPLLVSQWQQALRRRGIRSLEEWAAAQFAEVSASGELTGPPRRVMAPLQRFNVERIVREWGDVFGEHRVVLLAPVADRSRNLRAFEALMGVPNGLLRPTEEGNESLPYPEAETLRAFNRTYTERDGDHPTWMRAINTGAREPLRQLARHTTPYPIRAPRWIAERANEYAARWIDAVSATAATVVGDLGGLLVDPAAFAEEVAPPERVSTESAGRLMDLVFDAGLREAARVPAATRPADLTTYDGRRLVRELGTRLRRRLPGGGRR
ncbi:hypothetical protein GUY44_11250 [Pimelobacter simplex]|uniref:Uncharacterized protein n=1 Tax=Nocardioides simplex TaxID=2045 RepID=A0A0A1DHR0_NOCSI|nr:hypothetical protein [Pimelobacter simplex]AIY16048.1 hypothetical protein KR76_03435 [Pimelobacter simplex]MCG8151056.1 hypothetical protein [Pimelobacter simplex]GEB12313.1 hypothetical protein NSI01_06280 [Pimelobacter simplex]SFM96725.1 hypothetical protein SAMN05421671_4418 [Pimelobacter simplex]